LKKKLQGKYSKFFEVTTDSYGTWVDMKDDLLEMVTNQKSKRRDSSDIKRITATITINNADLVSTQNFLWKLCEMGMGGFQFNDKSTKVKDTIGINEFDAHLWIVQQALNILSDSPEETTKTAAQYLLGDLPKHLRSLRESPEFGTLTDAEKRKIGSGVFSLIVKGDTLGRLRRRYSIAMGLAQGPRSNSLFRHEG
jgi:hypothetical protein